MINKIRILILLITLGVCTVSSVTYAAECSEEAKQNARQAATEKAKESFETVKKDAEAYNALAKEYLNQCNAQVPAGDPVGSSKEAVSAASQAGIPLDDPEIHQYRNISWLGPSTGGCLGNDCNSPKVAECKQKASAAVEALVKLNKSISSTEQQLYATTNEAMTNCKCDENGVADCAVVKPSDEIEAEGGECQITGFLNSLTACPLCPLFETVMKTNADIAHLSWEAAAEPLSKVVGIFFLVLLALEALKAVAAVGGTKPSAVMKGVLLLCLKFGITLGLLSNSHYIYSLFISPVMQGGLEMGLAVAQSSGGANCSIDPVSSISSQEINPKLFNTVIGTVRCFSQDAATMPAIGMGLLCLSESFTMFISGLLLLFFGFMIWLAFSFYLIDATVQLGMLCALVPLLIAFWPFEMTKQYTAKGVRMLMNTFFTFAFAGVLMMMASDYVTAALTGGGASATGDLINAIDNNDKPTIERVAALEGSSIMTLIACCVFAMKMIGNMSGLATQLSKGGSGMSYGAKLGGMATSAASGATKWAGGKMIRGLGKGAKIISDETGLTAAAKKGMGAVQRGWGKTWAGAGKVVGLGKFQNSKAGSGAQEHGTEEERGRSATPETQQRANNTNNNTNDNNNINNTSDNDDNNNTTNDNNNGGSDNNTTNDNNGGSDNNTTNDNNGGGNSGGGDNNGGGDNTTNDNNGGGDNGGSGDNTTTNNNNDGGSGNDSGGDNGKNNDNTETIQNDDGSTTQKSYDENGKLQRESTTDKDGNESWKSYNEDGSIKAQGNLNADGTGNATLNDEHGNKMQENSWDKNGNESSKFYDKEGKLTGTHTSSKDDQGNTHWRNTDANGKMTSSGVNNKDGSAVQMDYNENGKVQREIHRTAGGGMKIKNHSYDENGNFKPRKFLGKVIKDQ